MFYILKYQNSLRKFFVGFMKNEPQDLIEQEVGLFIDEYLNTKKNTQTQEMLTNSLKDERGEVWLVSASFYPIVAGIAKEFGVEHFIATQLEVDNGIYTGRILKEMEHQKLLVLQQKHLVENREHIFVYTDSKSDADIVGAATEAWLVANPKDKLFWKELAERRNVNINFLR